MSDTTPIVTVAVTARNEAAAIGNCLRSLLVAQRAAEAALALRFRIVVVLDECSDATGSIARSFSGVETLVSRGGIVEAQRSVAGARPFVVFSDADILVGESALLAVCRTMLADPALQVAYPRKSPLPPRRRTLLAQALYSYNRTNGFQDVRRYFNGKFFAIRDWRVPSLSELASRLAQLPRDAFYDFHAGMRIDDIWLSRDILARYGESAIHEVEDGEILFRPPETFTGMYRTYRRMRLEIEQLNILFPETLPVHQARKVDESALARASRRERMLWRWFHAWLRVCIARYSLERWYYRRWSPQPCPAWPRVEESKEALCRDIAHPG